MTFRKDVLEQDRKAAADELRAARLLQERAEGGGDPLTEAEQKTVDAALAKGRAVSDRLAAQRHDEEVYAVARGMSEELGLSIGGAGGAGTKGSVTRGRPALALSEAALKSMHHAVISGGNFDSKAYSTVDGLLPPALAPYVIGPAHPDRLLDRLPSAQITAPSLEYLVHQTTTGTPAITAEGAAKPELVFNSVKVTATAQKIAAHTAVSYESMEDFATFLDYVQNELTRQAIDVENAELLNGDGTAGHLTGLCHTSGILTHALAAPETGLDAIEVGITNLKVGPQLATADLLVLHPATWSSIRRTKDTQGRYLAASDPTVGEAMTAWGVPVLTTVVMPVGEALVMDTAKFGRVLIREPLGIKTGTNNDDFTKNLTRFVVEERLTLAVERPGALLLVTGL